MLTENERRLVDRLPPAARARLVLVCGSSDSLTAASWQMSARRRDLHHAIDVEKTSLTKIQSEPPYVRDDEAVAMMARESITAKQAERADLDAAIAENGERRRPLGEIIRRALEALGTIPPGFVPQVSDRPPAVVKKSEGHATAVERLRGKIQELRGELETVETAPWPSALVKERARRDLERLATPPTVTGMIDHGELKIRWPETTLRLAGEATTAFIEVSDSLGVLAWLFQDQMIAKIEREIDDATDDANALAPADRKAATERIVVQIDELERDECSVIEAAAKAGANIPHRADVDIFALLGLSRDLVQAPAKPKSEPRTITHHTPAPIHESVLPAVERRDDIWQ